MGVEHGGVPLHGADQAANPPRVVVLCPTHRDYRELARLARPDATYLFHDFSDMSLEELIGAQAGPEDRAACPLDEVALILAELRDVAVEAVVSTDDYPGSALAAIVAQALGLPGPEPRVNLVCQHKYLARVAQSALVPEAVPAFALVDVALEAMPALDAPFLVKPVKSFFSIGAETIATPAALADLRARFARLDQFFLPLERLLQRFAGEQIGTKRLIAEGLLKGEQVTVEGYALQGEITILGVVDSIMFPGTRSFARFEYPSALPESVQARMAEIAARLMAGIGFDNGMFNIEMMYDAATDRIGIIEINPRMASQFADLYEKVDGTNSYSVLLDIGLGVRPTVTRRDGAHRFAASFVLRSFEDRIVAALPSEAALADIARREPDIRVELLSAVGRRLSQEMHDDHSYRYGIVNLGAQNRTEAMAKFEAIRAELGILLVPVDAAPRADEAQAALMPAAQA
jgi:biotin carboxylase